jgi:predicted DNA-binding transcriptional regulator YafY
MCWHVFTWGTSIEILEPAKLRERMTTLLRAALEHHDGADAVAV